MAWTPEEFLRQALAADHPFDSVCVSNDAAFAISQALSAGPAATAEHQRATLERWEKLAVELEPANDALCSQLHADVKPFAQSKKPLLLKAILEELQFPSVATELLHDFPAHGFPAFGPFPETGIFPPRDHAAAITREDLMKSVK
jgi:hypothetical protein